MDCTICFGIYEDPRILHCGHTFCYKCAVSMISNKIIECPICRRVFPNIVPQKLKKNFQLSELIEEITKKANVNNESKSSMISPVNNQSFVQNIQNFGDSGPNINQNVRRNSLNNEYQHQCHNQSIEDLASDHVINSRVINYSRKFYNVTKPSVSSFRYVLVFLILYFPFDVAGIYFIDKNDNDCSKIQLWLIVWIACNIAFVIVAIFNTGFIREDWQDLTLFEKILKVLVHSLVSFMFAWLWVGVSWVFVDSKCEKESQGIWAVTVAVLIMWIIVTGLVVVAMIFILFYKLGLLKCILNFRHPKLKKSLYMLMMFLLLFFPFDVVGIHFLSTTDEDCKDIRQWLTIWTIFCFALLVKLILNTGFFFKIWNRLSYSEICLRMSLIFIILFMFAWLFVGSSIVFHNTECKSHSYKLWSISMAIIIFWLCLIFLALLNILYIILSDYGFFYDFKFKFNWLFICSFTLLHLLLFEVQSFIGIAFLNNENDCKSKELYHKLRIWLIVWIAISLFSMLWYNFVCVSRGSSGFNYLICILAGITITSQIIMVFLGAGFFFDDFGFSASDSKIY